MIELLSKFMQQSPSWEAASGSATQKLPKTLWNQKVHYRDHKSRSTGLYIEPHESNTYPHSISLRSILILSSHLRVGFPIGLFPSGFPTETL
jgi:hypothetical protein